MVFGAGSGGTGSSCQDFPLEAPAQSCQGAEGAWEVIVQHQSLQNSSFLFFYSIL